MPKKVPKDDETESGTKRRARRKNRATLRFQDHQFQPEDILHFLELKNFTKRWNELELDDEDDLLALQLMIMANPKGAQVIEGTDGLRKLRFAPSRWNCGKSGAARILYVLFEEFGVVLLALAYRKSEVDTISAAVKKHLNGLIRDIDRELKRRQTL